MIRHLTKLVWSRRRSNALLVLEIFVSFLVLFAVTASALVFLNRIRQPLGFSYENLYTATIDQRDFDFSTDLENRRATTRRLLREIENLPEVEAVGAINNGPFELGYSTESLSNDERSTGADSCAMTDGGLETLGLRLTQGRWFEPGDDTLSWTPVVVNHLAVETLFGEDNPIGQIVDEENDLRIVGVVESFRKNGYLSSLSPSVIKRASLLKAGESAPPQRILIRVSPGHGATIEERVLETMRGVEPDWNYQIEATDSIRRRNGKMATAPLVIGVMVAGFLLLMVFLGMVGVFWQAVTQRKGEIGLRRAIGAPRNAVYLQTLSEILIVTAFGAFSATILIVQLPLLGVLSALSWGTVGKALLVSLALMGLLATGSGIYPAWLAARVEPADALHDE